MKTSQLYAVLDKMPKGGLHHLHTTATPQPEFYVSLTYNDYVYFNEREQLFKVAPVRRNQLICYQKGLDEDGFIKCTDMRNFWSSPEAYDEKLKNYIRLTPEEISSKESHIIW